ncbi:hypothetical protein JTB14_007096 [Gonioctena quinquepunctata]|nr:hypothetical protein JTB14_007096 [Gonioctena quinquepunctata]
MAADMRSPNISVTPINMEPYPPPPPVLVNGADHHPPCEPPQRTRSAPHPAALISNGNVDVLDSSDAEVAGIDFHAVNMRSNKKKRDDIPRPMSWEGELSDGERDGMCIDEENSTQVPENLSLGHSKPPIINDTKDSPILRLKQPPMGNYSLHSTPSNSPLLSQRHPVTGVPIISHKDLMHKALNVPPTPSPDSAIHSAYSVFSSPNQSPLTQRHITLTPNLSRNNSDASHSSCCSYSSVSVSVSPTQQFSPTHSPIQMKLYGRPKGYTGMLGGLINQ